ncbi:MAG: carbohydrate ABC transporter permease [Treponema sp.]|jgi:ABC-type glycerol-3-phosphate transport system permease component|nr:carbohydrate ABC transporter permease [Treponema sp.]
MMQIFLLSFAAVIAALIILSRFFDVWKKGTLYIILILLAFTMIMPFYMMFIYATLPTNKIFSYPPVIWFGSNIQSNLRVMNRIVNVLQSYLNSIIVTVSNTVLVLLFCSMGGYAFAMHNFRFKKQLFGILLVTMMIPWTAGIVPWFWLMSKFGWINDFKALIIPSAANAFGIFWMRQYCARNVPQSILDAARIDGCSEWTLFFHVVTPVILPAYASLGIMQFVNVWNDFVAPMMILRRKATHTLPIMLKTMVGDRGTDYGALMLASTCAVLPLLIVFLMASKFFMSGLTAGAIKE